MNTRLVPACSAVLLLGSAASAQTAAPASQAAVTPVAVTPVAGGVVGRVQFVGLNVFSSEQIAAALAERLGIKPGAQVSGATLEEGRTRLAAAYLEAGVPFTPTVRLETRPGNAGLDVIYTVTETVPLSRVEVSGAALLGAEKVRALFGPLQRSRQLTPEGYEATLGALAQAYSERGVAFRAQDVQASYADGVLRVRVTEPFVGTVDVSALPQGAGQAALLTRPGQPLRSADLNTDARLLGNAAGVPVVWEAAPGTGGRLNVTFRPLTGVPAERVRRVEVSGNTRVSTTDVLRAIGTQSGDVANPQLTQQDFYALQKLYNDRGYALAATEDSLQFQNGVLTFNLHEARIDGYVLKWPGKPLLREELVRHHLPPTGAVFERDAMREALLTIQSYDNVQFVGQETEIRDPAHPERVTLVLQFAERKRSVPVSADFSYAPQEGIGASAMYGTNNLFGTGNGLALSLGANASDVGDRFSGSVNYTIPWVDANFLDFKQRPTSLSVGVWSTVSGNNPLYVKDASGLPNGEDTGRQYSVRSTGASLSLGRQLSTHVSATAGVAVSTKKVTLEPYKTGDAPDVTGSTYQDDAAAQAQVPLGNTAALATLGFRFDKTDSAAAPNFGSRAYATLGYGFGLESSGTRLSWGQLEGGARLYTGFGRTLADGSKQEVLAGRIDAGTIVGKGGEGSGFRVGAGAINPAYELRGFGDTLHGTTYLTGSAELRHNFGISGNFVKGVYGLAFVDAGDAWTVGSAANTFGLNVGYGVGAQLNTGLGNFQFAYGLNNRGGSKFSLRFGSFW